MPGGSLAPLIVRRHRGLRWSAYRRQADAGAAPRPERPYRGLFAGGGGPGGAQSLIGQRLDRRRLRRQHPAGSPGWGGSGADPRLIAKAASLAAANGSLSYTRQRPRVDVRAALEVHDPLLPRADARTSSPALRRRNRQAHVADRGTTIDVFLQPGAHYQPYTFATVATFRCVRRWAADSRGPAGRPGTGARRILSLRTQCQLVPTTSHALDGLEHWIHLLTRAKRYWLTPRSPSTVRSPACRYQLGADWARIGYALPGSRYSTASTGPRAQHMDVGVDYNRALSFSRTHEPVVCTGTSAVKIELA